MHILRRIVVRGIKTERGGDLRVIAASLEL